MLFRMKHFYTFLMAMIWQVHNIDMALYTDVQALYNNLTVGHSKYLRPQIDYDKPAEVTISFVLLNLVGIDAVAGTMSVAGYFVVSWRDENLVWTPSDYNDTNLITLPHDVIWKPPLINNNGAKEMTVFSIDHTYVQLYSNGTVEWLPGQNLEFVCDIDTTYFPFDTQECELFIITWGYPMSDIVFKMTESTVNTDCYSTDSEWDLIETSTYIDNSMIPTAKFKFKYKRRPLFLLITLLLPAVFMALLNIFVFFLPQDSGERIGFAITLLLTVVVYMTIAQELLPATAMPRLSARCVMLMVNLFMSGMIVLSVIVSAWYYYKPDDEQIPKWIQTIVQFNFLRRCQTSSNQVDNVNANEQVTSKKEMLLVLEDELTWVKVARFLDKMFVIIYTLFLIIGNLAFIIDIASGI